MTGQSVAFDRIAGCYDDTRGGMERGRVIADLLVELLPTGGPLLEVGVGTGLVAAAMAERGRRPVGLDLSMPMLARARDRLPGLVAAGDAHRLPVRTGSVAAAYLVHVLHLVGDIPATLAEVARVVRPGGTLVATAFPRGPVEGDVFAVVDEFRDRLGPERRHEVDTELVTRLAVEAGFTPAGRRDGPSSPVTPRNTADLFAARSTSWMWSVDDEVWSRELPGVLERLRALPDQDRVRPGPGSAVLAFDRP